MHGGVALVYWAGVLNVPGPWMFYLYKSALLNVCYALVGLFFLLYGASSAAFRWTIIPVGAAFGFLAPIVGQHVVMLMFEPQRWINLLTHRPLQMVMSNLGYLVFGVWLGGAIAGAIAFISWRVLDALEQRPTPRGL
jgi:hypothetical protein